MKKLIYLILIALFSLMAAACARAAPQNVPGMINPGDRVGDFLITADSGEDVVLMTNIHCPYEETTETCERPVGTKVNVANGIYGDLSDDKVLEKIWKKQTYEMTIEGRPVNLPAFGFVEFEHPVVGTVRVWNVVVTSDRPGVISAHSSGEVDGEPLEYTAVVKFSAP